jgi:maltose O-acetyltransferase
MKTELQKCLEGNIIDTLDKEILAIIYKARKLPKSYNETTSTDPVKQQEILEGLFGKTESNVNINAPFYCDYGRHIFIGKNSVIGTGSIVTKSIPENCLVVGNPCRVIRKINKKR